MFCPSCGLENQGKVKFCRRCGTNLIAVMEVVQQGTTKMTETQLEAITKEQLKQTLMHKIQEADPAAQTMWGAPMLPELVKQLEQLTMTEEERGRRYIRHGMITIGVGLGVSLFLYLFFNALTSTDLIPENVAPILRMIWANGLIPLFIGLMLLLYGVFFCRPSRQRVRSQPGVARELQPSTNDLFLERQANFNSVTEQTTTRLESPESEWPVKPVSGRSGSER